MKRKICVVTGTRAEYGLLYQVLRRIAEDPALRLQLVVCAAHLSPEHGMTIRQIEEDGFTIDAKVDMLLAGDSRETMAKSTGLGVLGFCDAFSRLRPDIIVILGDRFEMLAAAQTALLLNIPIAHIHGGEITTGAIDDSIRHAITKMAALHFTATEEFRRRVIQMGEPPHRVFNTGALGLEYLRNTSLLNRQQLEEKLDFNLDPPLFLVTLHPVTRNEGASGDALKALFLALESYPETRIIWTCPNADSEGRMLWHEIEHWANTRFHRPLLSPSLGQRNYLSALKLADVVIGNSSSGIIEAPAVGTPTVNIGNRQNGRPRAASILDCPPEADAIRTAIKRALSPEFLESIKGQRIPYGCGETTSTILEQLKKVELAGLAHKEFHCSYRKHGSAMG